MKQNSVINDVKELVRITIKKHKEDSLGKEKMSNFIKKNIKKEISNEDYNTILHLYSRYLAIEGYEIVNDINHFDIINYNTEEYYTYLDNLKN